MLQLNIRFHYELFYHEGFTIWMCNFTHQSNQGGYIVKGVVGDKGREVINKKFGVNLG